MKEIVDYLMKNYYSKYDGGRPDLIPDPDALLEGLMNHQDNLVVIRHKEINGVAVYLTLTDATYAEIEKHNITEVEELVRLLEEKGDNYHFVLLAADGLKTIVAGIQEVKKKRPKTLSWWNPDNTYLHKYNLN